MANLSTLLKDILIREDKITVPGFGTFETTYQSAQLDEKTGVIHPPTKSVSLDTTKTEDPDGKLASALAKIGISDSEVQPMVAAFISTVKNKLADKATVSIDEVGVISADDKGNPVLKPVTSKLSIDNYGLDTEEIEPVEAGARVVAAAATQNGGKISKSAAEDVKAQPKTSSTTKTSTTKTVTTTTTTKTDKEPKKKSSLLKWLIVILPIVAILAILFVVFKDKILGTSDTNIVASNEKPATSKPSADDNSPVLDVTPDNGSKTDAKADSKPQQNQQNQPATDPDLQILAGAGFANVSPQDLGSKYKKYYLVGGSFKDKAKATQEKQRLGASDILHVDGSDLYRVVFVGSDSAQEVVDVYRKTINRGIASSNIWLLKNSKNSK